MGSQRQERLAHCWLMRGVVPVVKSWLMSQLVENCNGWGMWTVQEGEYPPSEDGWRQWLLALMCIAIIKHVTVCLGKRGSFISQFLWSCLSSKHQIPFRTAYTECAWVRLPLWWCFGNWKAHWWRQWCIFITNPKAQNFPKNMKFNAKTI
jgi:hypothetical protein